MDGDVDGEGADHVAGVVEEQGRAAGVQVAAVAQLDGVVLDRADETLRVVDGARRLVQPGERRDLAVVVGVDLARVASLRFSPDGSSAVEPFRGGGWRGGGRGLG